MGGQIAKYWRKIIERLSQLISIVGTPLLKQNVVTWRVAAQHLVFPSAHFYKEGGYKKPMTVFMLSVG